MKLPNTNIELEDASMTQVWDAMTTDQQNDIKDSWWEEFPGGPVEDLFFDNASAVEVHKAMVLSWDGHRNKCVRRLIGTDRLKLK